MEIAKGYKQTEVGVIPEDWDTPQIEALTSIATGSTPPTSNTSNYGDQYMFAGPADIGGKKYIHNTVKKLSTRGFKISRKFPKGSTLFVCIGSTIGKCAIATTKLTSNQQINAVFPCDHLDSEYVYYALCSRSLSIKALAGEQAVPLVNKTQFGETLIPLPPTKAEQEAIAEALSDADSLIESLQQLIAKKRQIKQGAMQELLRPKDDWVEKTLGEVSDISMGRTPARLRNDYWGGDNVWLSIADMKKKTLYNSKEKNNKTSG
jgi:type I restriction enzyme S subunit